MPFDLVVHLVELLCVQPFTADEVMHRITHFHSPYLSGKLPVVQQERVYQVDRFLRVAVLQCVPDRFKQVQRVVVIFLQSVNVIYEFSKIIRQAFNKPLRLVCRRLRDLCVCLCIAYFCGPFLFASGVPLLHRNGVSRHGADHI